MGMNILPSPARNAASEGSYENPGEVGAISVRPFTVNSLTLFLVVALLGIIVVVLILPDADLPDTAFQRNTSLQAFRALSHQMPHASANAGQHISFHTSGISVLTRQVRETHARCSNDLPIEHKALRC
jgi:hypothetical protein